MNTRLSLRRRVCSICFENIDTKGQLDNCKHQFCFDCIKIWADKQSSCPVCRAQFKRIKKTKSRVNYNENKIKQPNFQVVYVEPKKQQHVIIPAREIIPFMIQLFGLIGESGTLTFL